MELIVTILVALPLGFFIPSRVAAYVAFIAIHSFVLSFSYQCMELIREWVGGDYSAFPRSDPQAGTWNYAVINLIIYAAGFGLVALGRKLGAKRRNRTAERIPQTATPVDLAK